MTLEARNAEEWQGAVTIVSTDMRAWDTPHRADIMVNFDPALGPAHILALLSRDLAVIGSNLTMISSEFTVN